jgi:hypothetical protein
MTAKKDRSTPEGERLWKAAEEAAAKVRDWPAWKRGQFGKPESEGDSPQIIAPAIDGSR